MCPRQPPNPLDKDRPPYAIFEDFVDAQPPHDADADHVPYALDEKS